MFSGDLLSRVSRHGQAPRGRAARGWPARGQARRYPALSWKQERLGWEARCAKRPGVGSPARATGHESVSPRDLLSWDLCRGGRPVALRSEQAPTMADGIEANRLRFFFAR